MKKIITLAVMLMVAYTANAQVVELYKGTKLVTSYVKSDIDKAIFKQQIKITGISISATSAEIKTGNTLQLAATISPDNASYKTLSWSSSNTQYATVDQNGLVKGVLPGSVTITATATDGSGIYATYDLEIKRHGYVDLGLSVLWATYNVGAEENTDYGDFFAWGETSEKGEIFMNYWDMSNYYWSNYKWCNGTWSTLTKYCTKSTYGTVDNYTVLHSSEDAATVNWGDNWRMPTKAEIQELKDNCTWKYRTDYSPHGFLVVSNVAGYTDKSIFLPCAGFVDDDGLDKTGSNGYYWSSTLNETYNDAAYWIYLLSTSDPSIQYHYRYYGGSVRPVRAK